MHTTTTVGQLINFSIIVVEKKEVDNWSGNTRKYRTEGKELEKITKYQNSKLKDDDINQPVVIGTLGPFQKNLDGT